MIAQLSNSVIGYVAYLDVGAGYNAAVSLVLAISLMILTKAMHLPVVSIALIFAFKYKQVDMLVMFFIAVSLLSLLIRLQRASLG